MSILSELLNMNTSSNGRFVDEDSFLYLNNNSGTNQIWFRNSNGEDIQITFLENRVWSFDLTPCGKNLVFVADASGNENTQIFYLKDWRTTKEEPINLIDNSIARCQYAGIQAESNSVIYTSNERNSANFDICKVNYNTGQKSIIIKNEDNYNFPAGLSTDGKYLLINKLKAIDDNFLWLANLETGEFIKLMDNGINASFESPSWKSDGSGFYFVTDLESEFKYLAYYDIANKSILSVFKSDWDVSKVELSPNDSLLAFLVNKEGYNEINVLDIKSNRLINISKPPMGVIEYYDLNWSENSDKLIFSLSSGSKPLNIWTLDTKSGSVIKNTSNGLNENIESQLIEPTLEHFVSFDGLKVPYWYYKSGQDSKAVVLDVHGGPEGQAKLTFSATIQELVSQGVSVIEPNIRGSVGYGKTYHLLDNVDKRLDSVKDIEHLTYDIVNKNIANKDKIAIMGASYGGYMTLASLAFYPDLWAAGIDIVGMSDLETFLINTADYRRSHRESEYGSLEHDLETLRRVSPIHKADNIVAPLMVVHGANDPRVPLSEAEQIIKSLNDRNVPVESLIYPDEGHGLSKKKNQLDAYPKMISFLKEHLKID